MNKKKKIMKFIYYVVKVHQSHLLQLGGVHGSDYVCVCIY